MSPAGFRIEALLPHRGRMKLIEEILEIDDKRAVTRATVSERWPLFKGASVHALICVELVAQTAGISNSWCGIKKHGAHFVNRGWLVGIKSAVFHVDAIPVNACLLTRADNDFEYEGFREILGTVETGSKMIAEVRLQLMQAE